MIDVLCTLRLSLLLLGASILFLYFFFLSEVFNELPLQHCLFVFIFLALVMFSFFSVLLLACGRTQQSVVVRENRF